MITGIAKTKLKVVTRVHIHLSKRLCYYLSNWVRKEVAIKERMFLTLQSVGYFEELYLWYRPKFTICYLCWPPLTLHKRSKHIKYCTCAKKNGPSHLQLISHKTPQNQAHLHSTVFISIILTLFGSNPLFSACLA